MSQLHDQPARRRIGARRAAVGLGAVAVAGLLAACGGGSSGGGSAPSTSPAAAASSPAAGGGSGATGSGGTNGFRGAAPAASGTIAAVAAGSIEVQSQTSGQSTVDYTSKTAITATDQKSLADVTVGSCVLASPAATSTSGSGSSSAGSASPSPTAPKAITATTVVISKAVNGSCTAFGGGGGFPGGTRASGTRPTDRPSGATGSRPPGSFGARGGFGDLVTGTVSAVSGSTITVKAQVRGTTGSAASTTTDTVTVTSATTYTETEAATSAALKVGLCATATGTTNSTGTVAATRIAVTPSGANGCSTGFGGFGGRGAGGTGGAGGPGTGASGTNG